MILRRTGTLGLAVLLIRAAAPAVAAPVDTAAFSGTFHTHCTMPFGPEGPYTGAYSCTHSTMSMSCAAVVDTGAVTTYAKVCRADLTSGSTAGTAAVVASGVSEWTCQNGSGPGMFRYQPSPVDPALPFPVWLSVTGPYVVVSGSYTQAGTGRTVVVRAHFPAVCTFDTTAYGYDGTITAA